LLEGNVDLKVFNLNLKVTDLLIITFAIISALFGAYTARKNGGNKSDLIQYLLVYLIIGAVIGLFTTLAIEWL
jgi:prolipoprotein diacylglyceryltransferase